MRRMYTFSPSYRSLGMFAIADIQPLIKHEPMLFSADFRFAMQSGGPITRRFLYALPDDIQRRSDLIIDSRVHMLMPGWFPCIPGWHHDDVPRTRPDGQPDYNHPNARDVQHVLAIVDSGTGSMTEFLAQEIVLKEVPLGKTVYKEFDKKISETEITVAAAKNGEMIHFDGGAFHRGTPARSTGWRWFCRVSYNSTRTPVNEIRQNANVYMSDLNSGW